MVHFPPIPPSLIIRDEDEEDEEEEKKKKRKFRVSIQEWDEGNWVETDVLEGKLTYDKIDEIKKLLIDKYKFKLESYG